MECHGDLEREKEPQLLSTYRQYFVSLTLPCIGIIHGVMAFVRYCIVFVRHLYGIVRYLYGICTITKSYWTSKIHSMSFDFNSTIPLRYSFGCYWLVRYQYDIFTIFIVYLPHICSVFVRHLYGIYRTFIVHLYGVFSYISSI